MRNKKGKNIMIKKSIILSACLIAVSLQAKMYKSVVQPYETITVSSEVNGKVTSIKKDIELTNFSGEVISIDSKLDNSKLKNLKSKLSILKEQLNIKDKTYKSIKKIRAKGQIEKDKYKLDVLSIKSQIIDLESSIDTLEDTISKKSISVNNLYIKDFLVSKDEVVFAGTKLFSAENQNISKIVAYINAKDRTDLSKKQIIINGKIDHGYKISKVSNSTDSTYISAYKLELINETKPDLFGQVVSVEIK
jgi:seryl-tRNA synthetase